MPSTILSLNILRSLLINKSIYLQTSTNPPSLAAYSSRPLGGHIRSQACRNSFGYQVGFDIRLEDMPFIQTEMLHMCPVYMRDLFTKSLSVHNPLVFPPMLILFWGVWKLPLMPCRLLVEPMSLSCSLLGHPTGVWSSSATGVAGGIFTKRAPQAL